MTAVVILLVVVVVFAGWRIELRQHPWTRCRRCRGSGHNAGSSSGRWGTCSRCGGTGKRRRLGAPPGG